MQTAIGLGFTGCLQRGLPVAPIPSQERVEAVHQHRMRENQEFTKSQPGAAPRA